MDTINLQVSAGYRAASAARTIVGKMLKSELAAASTNAIFLSGFMFSS